MSDKPETLAAIIAKYRKDIAGGQFFTPTQEYILRLLDRIEAAVERERVKARHDAAEMREALVEILDRTNREKARDYDAALNGGILEIHDIANTAIDQIKGE